MTLPGSGAISFSQIGAELQSSSFSLRTMSAVAGKATPDSVSEFYGYSSVTCTPYVFSNSLENSIEYWFYPTCVTGEFGQIQSDWNLASIGFPSMACVRDNAGFNPVGTNGDTAYVYPGFGPCTDATYPRVEY